MDLVVINLSCFISLGRFYERMLAHFSDASQKKPELPKAAEKVHCQRLFTGFSAGTVLVHFVYSPLRLVRDT